MMSSITRRHFIGTTATAFGMLAVPSLSAIAPFQRIGAPALRPALAAYSFRQYFRHFRDRVQEPPNARTLDMFGFIDFCAEQGLSGAELTSYFFPPDADASYFLKVRRHAFLRGVSISGTAVGNNFARAKGEALDREIAHVKRWIDQAASMGAPHIRVFAGEPVDIDEATAMRNCIQALEECCDYAGGVGIFLGLENHGGIVARPEQLLQIVRAVDSPWFGVNLDTGNFRTADPYKDIEAFAPYAVNVQLKAELGPSAERQERADFRRLIEILRGANYQGFVALEYEEEADPWIAVPELLDELKQRLQA